jgi:molybdate transport system ATP-binding protein
MPQTDQAKTLERSAMPLLTVNNALCRIDRNKLLKVGRFEVAQGEHWCIFGGNGSGKSVLARLISGERVESNNYVSYRDGFDPRQDIFVVSFEEQQRLWQRDNRLDISEFSDAARDQGTLVRELIASSRTQQEQDQLELTTLVERVDLVEEIDKGIRFLSSGQVRKALIARAIYAKSDSRPKLLILDEPLESIDLHSQAGIATAMQQWMNESNSTLLLCRRQQDILPAMNRMAVMEDLQLIEQGAFDGVSKSKSFRRITQVSVKQPDLLPLAIKNHKPPDMEDSAALIELSDVTASYQDQRVLSNVNWVMQAHHHVLIEGPNGCGKSTLLSLIDGDNHKAYGQQVTLFGRKRGSGETVWDVKAHFGVVSNELHNKYIKGWKVLDVVVSGFFDSVGLYDDSGSSESSAALSWLSALGVEQLAAHYYHELSFGQQRLVLLARAMVKHPAILILDEPCVGLDDYHRQLILQTLDAIAQQTDTKLIYVSHVVEEKPKCINQHIGFIASAAGGYTIQLINP